MVDVCGVEWSREVQFRSEKRDNLTGGVEWRFCEVHSDFVIIADLGGIRFTGSSPELAGKEDMDMFAQIVAMAWQEHLRFLKAKIQSSLTGH